MSRVRLFAIVEGSKHDIPFYEGMLTDGAGLSSMTFIKAQDLSIDGKSAGGKTHSIKLFEELKKVDGLKQSNSSTNVDVLFFLDRDDDDFLDKMIDSPHICYTANSDIEAEIVSNSKLPLAVANAFSLPRSDAAKCVPQSPLRELFNLWKTWIILRLTSAKIGVADARFAQKSPINVGTYMCKVDNSKILSVCGNLRENDPISWDQAYSAAEMYVTRLLDQGTASSLVKGKWLSPYIIHQVGEAHSGSALPSVSNDQLITACLGALDFSRIWDSYYRDQLGFIAG